MIMANITLGCDIDYAIALKIKKTSSSFANTDVAIFYAEKLVSANNLLNLLALAAKNGTPCVLIASGTLESQAVNQLTPLLAAPKS
ncbi:MAG: HPr family phosphocarrier protein [Puniceicoccales bacterium]|jgi:phosphotransferase system HPr-like phosphotransfer protein|nr:HPr family phosphocarrier protein [Puniceicoccales bacterium]